MPAERSRGSRRTGADGNQLVWTEPALAPGIAFATNLTPGAFEESKEPSNPSFTTFDSTETKLEPVAPSLALVPAPTFFFVDAPPADESKPKRASHKRKATPPPPSPSSTAFPASPGASDADASPAGPAPAPAAHIPRPPNAFILFRSSFIRAGAVPAHVEPSHASLSAIAGLTWAALPKPEKEAWHRRAKEERERHRERFPNYAFRPRHRTTSTPSSNSAPEDGDCEDSGGGSTQRRRQQREVAPADRARQAHIASLLLTGLSGAALDEAIATFDRERKERGEGGVEVRFGVVETPEGRVAAEDASEKEKGKREGTPCVRRGTSKAEKRRPSAKQDGSGKRRRTTSSPSSPSPALASPAPSSPSLPATPTDTPHAPFAFDFDAPSSIPSTPVNDFSSAAAFEWPYASSPPVPRGVLLPLRHALVLVPALPPRSPTPRPPPPPHPRPPGARSRTSPCRSRSPPPPTPRTAPSPLSACSSMSSLGGDLGALPSLDTTADCSAAAGLSVDLSMYGALMPPYDLGLGFGGDMDMDMGMDGGMGMGYLTGFLEGTTQADGIAAW
ncbi:HMG box domain-containing protein [Mycena venus]|uniref:HMG box domain-containing protein n=1 Tax=Mycena venus TaxID=2733690 RepID=A0A8H6XAT9_9AGAR|nr:HMG box domain-containing protein [Mycena venus]